MKIQSLVNLISSTFITLLFLISSNSVKSQSLLDGSFENTISTGCYYGSFNSVYDSLMPYSVAYGVYEGVDIVEAGCYIPTIADGSYGVILANNPGNTNQGEAISLELSAPLIPGIDYDFSFQAHAITLYGPKGDILIGASTSATSFGTGIYTGVTVDDTWISYNFTFTATNNATHITVMPTPGIESWTCVDDFSISQSCAITGTDVQAACGSFTWIDGNTYTTDNNTATHNIVGGAANGCDSLVTLDLTINNVDSAISNSGTTIMANAIGATYQWLDCENSMSVILGETNQSFTPTSNGNYAVEVTENGCIDTSACSSIHSVGIVNNDFSQSFLVYPNPTSGNFSIDLAEDVGMVTISIVDLSGKLLVSETYHGNKLLSMYLDEPAGLYFLYIESDKKKAVLRLDKN